MTDGKYVVMTRKYVDRDTHVVVVYSSNHSLEFKVFALSSVVSWNMVRFWEFGVKRQAPRSGKCLSFYQMAV